MAEIGAFRRSCLGSAVEAIACAAATTRNSWQRHSGGAIAFYQNLLTCFSLLLVTLIAELTLTNGETGLLVPGVLCIALAHTLVFIESLGELRTNLPSVISTQEPFHGIALAALLRHR
ncbi:MULTISPECIES: hypothetical protein [Cyanophyceae]|uniref:Uncharacterized protein n=1 Tax=Leptolyngbya subtilissima DQ-A4 TaxID=2933933 RepID=A0ABV0K7P4_9CYAN|nr:hypothetical protein [Nodosilinea sp. FACHB-141]MBD2114861.1 hypothetical protein [Nodosilinea sp. FACHB-141]